MEKCIIFTLLCMTCFFGSAYGLQCYVCNEDHWNWGNCSANIEQCKNFQDSCVSYVQFTLPTTFHARGERHHKISKGCDTQQGCLKRQNVLDTSVCGRTAYDDWACVECCTGDLCNYFVTLGSTSVSARIWTVIAMSGLTLLYLVDRI